MPGPAQRLQNNWAALFKPRDPLKPSEWAERYAYLSREYDSKGGKLHLWPWQRDMVDDAVDPVVRGSVWQLAAQLTGKTVAANVVVAYFIEHRPKPQINIQPTLNFAQDWSKTRLATMLRDTPRLRGLVRTVKSEEGGKSTILMKEYPGGSLTGVGANSEAGLRSKSVGMVIAEEVDTWPPSAESGGDPFRLALVRMEGFEDSFWLMISTPLIKDASRIEAEMAGTDQQKWFVPCPICKEEFVIMWEHFKWPGPKNPKRPAETHEPENAYLECPNCAAELTDDDRIRMVQAGRWKATKPFNGIRGRWLNAFVALKKPHRGFRNRMHEFVSGFLEAKKLGPTAMQVWVNTVKAETYEFESEKPTLPETLYERRETYSIALLPERCLVLTCGADVQADRIEAEIVGFGADEESWGIDYRVFHGNVETSAPWDKFDQWIQYRFPHPAGGAMAVAATCIDANHKGRRVRAFCRSKYPRAIYPIIGRGGANPNPGHSWVMQGKFKRHALLYVSDAKETLYARTKITEGTEGYLHFPESYSLQWFQQLMSEKRVTRWVQGLPVKGFEPIADGVRNEALDARVYAMAAVEILRPNYKKIAESIAKRGEKPTQPAQNEPPAFDPFKVPFDPRNSAQQKAINQHVAHAIKQQKRGWMRM